MRLLTLLAAGLFAGALMAAPVPKEKKDAEVLQGKWQLTKIDLGADTPADLNKEVETGYFVFGADKKLTVRLPREKEDREGEYVLDPAASPKAIDVTMKGEDNKRLGLYEVDGDTLKLCLPSSPGNVRSAKLEPDGKRYVAVFTLTRAKDEKAKDEKRAKEEESLAGVWDFETIDTGGLGDPKPEELAKSRMTFGKGGKLVLVEPDGKEREYAVKLDPSAKAKAIDLVESDGTTLGVYELEGDTLRIALAQSGGDARPTALKANGKGVVVMTLKRVKGEKKDK